MAPQTASFELNVKKENANYSSDVVGGTHKNSPLLTLIPSGSFPLTSLNGSLNCRPHYVTAQGTQSFHSKLNNVEIDTHLLHGWMSLSVVALPGMSGNCIYDTSKTINETQQTELLIFV